MKATKRAPRRAALPTVWNLEQLDEELRVALGFAQHPGLTRIGDAPPQVVMQQRPKPQTRVEKKRADPVVMEPVPWTQAQLDTINATMAAHVADPLWGEKADARTIRLIVTDADLDAAINADPATLNATQKAVRKTAMAVRALARIARGQIQ